MSEWNKRFDIPGSTDAYKCNVQAERLRRSFQQYGYRETFKIYQHDCDYREYLKPASLLRYAQQVAMQSARNAGMTDAFYEQTHTAYLLAKLALRFDRVPRVDEKLSLCTLPQKAYHAVNKRITWVLDEAGAQVALIDSRWVVIDTQKRTILRTHPPTMEAAWADSIDVELPMKMFKPPLDQCECLGTGTANYSFCDRNGHINNASYVDILSDALPWQEHDTCLPEDLLVFYHKEIPRGERFSLYRHKTAPHQWYFNGQSKGQCCLEARLTMVPEKDK